MKAEATEKQTIWEERVRAWRASGVSARKFAESGGISVSSLRYWTYRLKGIVETPRLLRLVPKSAVSQALAEASPMAAVSQVAIEVGAVRVVVQTGFDHQLLAEVVGALAGVVR